MIIGDDSDFNYLDEQESQPVSAPVIETVIKEEVPLPAVVAAPETASVTDVLPEVSSRTPERFRFERAGLPDRSLSPRNERRDKLLNRFAARAYVPDGVETPLISEPERISVVVEGPLERVLAEEPVVPIAQEVAEVSENFDAQELLETLAKSYRKLVDEMNEDTKAVDLAAVFQVTHSGQESVGRVRILELPAGETVVALLHNPSEDDEFLTLACRGTTLKADGSLEETVFEANVRPEAFVAKQYTEIGTPGQDDHSVTDQLEAVVSRESGGVDDQARELAERVRLVLLAVKDEELVADPDVEQLLTLLGDEAPIDERAEMTDRAQALYADLEQVQERRGNTPETLRLENGETITIETNGDSAISLFVDKPQEAALEGYTFGKNGYFGHQRVDNTTSEIPMHVSAPTGDLHGRESTAIPLTKLQLETATGVVNQYLEEVHRRAV